MISSPSQRISKGTTKMNSLYPKEPNTLGKASLWLGITSITLVFGLGVCALAGGAQVPVAVNLLFVCAASSAFLGLLAAAVGLGGIFAQIGLALPPLWVWSWGLVDCACFWHF